MKKTVRIILVEGARMTLQPRPNPAEADGWIPNQLPSKMLFIKKHTHTHFKFRFGPHNLNHPE